MHLPTDKPPTGIDKFDIYANREEDSSYRIKNRIYKNSSVEMQRRLHTTREEDCTDAVFQGRVRRVCQAALYRPRPSMMGP